MKTLVLNGLSFPAPPAGWPSLIDMETAAGLDQGYRLLLIHPFRSFDISERDRADLAGWLKLQRSVALTQTFIIIATPEGNVLTRFDPYEEHWPYSSFDTVVSVGSAAELSRITEDACVDCFNILGFDLVVLSPFMCQIAGNTTFRGVKPVFVLSGDGVDCRNPANSVPIVPRRGPGEPSFAVIDAENELTKITFGANLPGRCRGDSARTALTLDPGEVLGNEVLKTSGNVELANAVVRGFGLKSLDPVFEYVDRT